MTGLAAAVGLGTALIGCGGGEGRGDASAAEPEASDAPAAAAKAKKRTTKVRLQDSDFGRVLFDSKGGALYLFTADGDGKSTCYGECAVEWPPFHARGRLAAGPGVKQGKLGRTTRSDGRRQVTYAGKPLYYWYRDPKNQILCHDVFEFGGDWLVVKASGKPAA
jgi:predicted lipoprotein with Yx(FWY)xxD motif